jgi:3-(methylthio)propanoyl-CoA dehydrogenase
VEVLVATARNAAPDDRLAGSYPLLTMTAVLTAGWLMERLGLAIEAGETEMATGGRLAAIEYFLSVVVPEALGLGAGAEATAKLFYRAPAEELA